MFGFSAKEKEAEAQAEWNCENLSKFTSPLYGAIATIARENGIKTEGYKHGQMMDERFVAVIAASAFCLACIHGWDAKTAVKALKIYFGYIEDMGGREALHLILSDPNLLKRHYRLVEETYQVWGVLSLNGGEDMEELAMELAKTYHGVI